MTFDPNKTQEFLSNFNGHKLKIRNFPGCQRLELYRDIHQNHIFFTYSYWDSENDLNTYRHSNLFKMVWTETKALFIDKPEAWSVDKLVVLNKDNN